MAKQEVGLKIDVDVQSVGNMKQELRKATQELIAMNEKFGSTSQEAIAAAKRVANLKDAIGDAKSLVDAFNPDARFKAFGQTLGAVAGGFSAVQGAMALVGSESEDVQKSLLKVQSALAIAQGVEQMGDFAQSFKNLKAVAIDAFKGIKAAIGSTGIGLLVVALGTIVAYWDEIKGAISGVSAEQKKLNAEASKKLETSKKELDALSLQENSLKLQGKSEREILQLKNKKIELTIKDSELQIQQNKITIKAQIEAAQRNKDILQGILTFISSPIAALLKGIDLIGSAVGKNFDLYNKFYGGISSLVFDPEKEREQGKKSIEEQDKALAELKSQYDGNKLSIQNIDKEAAKKELENQKKLNEDKKAFEKEYTDFIKAENEKRAKSQMNNFDKERFDIEKKYSDLIAKAKKYGLDTSEIERLRFQESKDLVNKATAEDTKTVIEANNKKLGDFTSMIPKMAAIQSTLTVNQQTEANIRKGIDENELATKQQFADQTAGILNGLANVLGAQTKAGKAAAIAAIIVEQAAAISRIVSNTAAANAKAVAASPLTGGMPFVALNTVSAAVSIASAIANARKSIQQINSNNQNPSGSAGGGGISTSAPIAPALAPQVQATQVNTEMVNQLGNRAARAYVLNSDIQNEQQRNAYINRNASIGTP